MSYHTLPKEILHAVKQQEFFISIVFVSPRSPQWPQVRTLLKSADAFIEVGTALCALFKKNPSSIALAHMILQISATWKSCYVFVDGYPCVSTKHIKWLECFSLSLRVENLRSHCFKASWSYSPVGNGKSFMLPCRLVQTAWFYEENPCTPEEQFQAAAVRAGVEQCPNFGKFPLNCTEGEQEIKKEAKEEPNLKRTALQCGLDFLKQHGFWY